MDYAELERLVDVVQNANIRELTLHNGSSRITIRKSGVKSREGEALVANRPDDWDPSDIEIAEDNLEVVHTSEDERAEATPITVTAPAVGIFRHIKPLIGLAALVKPGQVIGQIEAIRLYTEVKTPSAGRVVDVFVDDGMAVEYGQPLFAIETEI